VACWAFLVGLAGGPQIAVFDAAVLAQAMDRLGD
jgi:hypothetical protein